MGQPTDCPGCGASVRLSPGEVERILAEYVGTNDAPLASDDEYARRLAVCSGCPDLLYGTTCRHCGCLVAMRAKLAGKRCPATPARWDVVG